MSAGRKVAPLRSDPQLGVLNVGTPVNIPPDRRLDLVNPLAPPNNAGITVSNRKGQSIPLFFPAGGVASFDGGDGAQDIDSGITQLTTNLSGMLYAIVDKRAPPTFPSTFENGPLSFVVPVVVGAASFGPTSVAAATVETVEASTVSIGVGALIRFALSMNGKAVADTAALVYAAIKGGTSGTYYATTQGSPATGVFRLPQTEVLNLVVRNAGASAYTMAGFVEGSTGE